MINQTTRTLPAVPPPVIVGSAMLIAVVAGRFVGGGHVALGLALVLAIAYLLLATFDLAAAIAVWVALLFIVHLAALRAGPTAIEIVLVVAWAGAAGVVHGRMPVLPGYRFLPTAMVVFGGWISLSIVWAEKPGQAALSAGFWWEAIFAFVVVAMTLTKPRDVRWLALAFVIGSVVSVTIGLAGFGGPSDAATATAIGDRLVGGGGDPNYQAAAFVAAIFVTIGLTSVYRSRAARVCLSAALAVITLGFFATKSRGGLLALGFALIVALVLFPRLRGRILGWSALTAAALAVWLPTRPDILHRLTDFSGGGSGRQAQWTIAWRIFRDHPLIGIGLNQYRTFEARFTLEPGSLNHVGRVAETPELVHNQYLQLLTETGIIGLVAFLVVVLGSLRASWLASQRFEAAGRADDANLARSILIGTVAMLAAMVFISDGDDLRLWVLFALGPVLLSLASRMPPERTYPPLRPAPPP